jgi:hypothetical protein
MKVTGVKFILLDLLTYQLIPRIIPHMQKSRLEAFSDSVFI